MPRIKDYPRATELGNNDVFLVDGEAGTRALVVSNAFYKNAEAASNVGEPGLPNRMLYRGVNLGSTITSAQLTAIRTATFSNLFPGDYWVLNNVRWRIVDIDYFYDMYNYDTQRIEKRHHIVIMPDTSLVKANYHNTNSIPNGKIRDVIDLYTSVLPATFNNVLPTVIKNNALAFSVSVPNSKVSSDNDWYTPKLNSGQAFNDKIHIPTFSQLGFPDSILNRANCSTPFAAMLLSNRIKFYAGDYFALYSGVYGCVGLYGYAGYYSGIITGEKLNLRPYIIIG